VPLVRPQIGADASLKVSDCLEVVGVCIQDVSPDAQKSFARNRDLQDIDLAELECTLDEPQVLLEGGEDFTAVGSHPQRSRRHSSAILLDSNAELSVECCLLGLGDARLCLRLCASTLIALSDRDGKRQRSQHDRFLEPGRCPLAGDLDAERGLGPGVPRCRTCSRNGFVPRSMQRAEAGLVTLRRPRENLAARWIARLVESTCRLRWMGSRPSGERR
jgi:hypothetical protein